MLGRAAWFGGAVATAGAAGWTLGSVRSVRRARAELEQEQARLRDHAWVREYKAALRKQGFQDVSEARRVVESRFQVLHRAHMFSTAVLKGPDRLNAEGPLTLKNMETGEVVEIFHVGAELRQRPYFYSACATMFDECLAFTAFPWLPNKIGVTATLDLAQAALPSAGARPDDPDAGLVALHARPLDARGRKCGAEATLYELTRRGAGKQLASGRALFVEPWWGKYIARLL